MQVTKMKVKNEKLWKKVEDIGSNLIVGDSLGANYFLIDEFKQNLLTNEFSKSQSKIKYFYIPNRIKKIKGVRGGSNFVLYQEQYRWVLNIHDGCLCLRECALGQSGDSSMWGRRKERNQYWQDKLPISELPHELKSEVIKDKL